MAPKKPKQPTMLQRQRALRKQQQQTKQQASKQLPPKGQTAANSRQARGQRTTTAKAQAANQQRVIARGMEGFVRRGQAMDKLDKAAKGTQGSGTRTAGAGGGGLARTAKPVSKARRLPPSSQGANRIGNSSQPWGEQPVRKVTVRDLGSSNALKPGSGSPKQLPAAQQGPQPATRKQQAQAKADTAAKGSQGPNRVGQPAGAANRRYGANVVNDAVSRAQRTSRVTRGGGLLGKALTPLAMAQEVQDMASRDRRWNDYKERNYGNTRVKPKQGDAQSRFAGARDANLNRINNDPRFAAPKEKPKPPAPRPAGTQPSQPAARPAASRPSTPAAPAKPASPAAPKERRVSAATANRESGNYGTSRTNNPMIDDAMKARMRQREDATGVGPVKDGARYGADVKNNTKGVGPVKDGERYASNVKPSSSTPGKKKEDETKTMSVAERMRRRRAGLA